MSNTATVHSHAWYGDMELTLDFPSGWEVEILGPKDAPALSDTQIEQAFAEPIGTQRISALAKGKKSAAIVVDDLSRPTPAAKSSHSYCANLLWLEFRNLKSDLLWGVVHTVPLQMKKLLRKSVPMSLPNMR